MAKKVPDGLPSRAAIIDELGEVERKFRLWSPGVNPHAARLAELRATVLGWYAGQPPGAEFVEEGKAYRLQVKPCQYRRDMTVGAQKTAFTAMDKKGIDPFLVFKSTQENIQKLLGEAFLEEIAPKKRTGPRTMSLVAKAGPAAAQLKKEAA